MLCVDSNRPQQRAAFVYLDRRTTDDAVPHTRHDGSFEMLTQPIQRQVLTFQECRDYVVVGQLRRSDGDGCHYRSFNPIAVQQGRSFACAAAGTQHPVCFSRRSASFLRTSTCPSTCVVASSMVATMGSADFERL